jgi:hypothetical protein
MRCAKIDAIDVVEASRCSCDGSESIEMAGIARITG